MSYTDRLQLLQYESPKKKLFTLEFDSLTRSGGKKVGINEFPNQSETNEQELGNIANRFPVECYLTGNDYDREADRFWKALEEKGVGTLDHPRWGSYEVIPITYSQREEFVNGMGRAVFTIEFIRYYPETNFLFGLLNSVQGIFDLVIEGMDRVLSLETSARRFGRNLTAQVGTNISEVNRIEQRTKNVLSVFKGQNKNFGQRTQELADSINAQEKKITRDIDRLAREPADLVNELVTLFTLPSKIESSIRAKTDGYLTIFNSIQEQFFVPGARFTDFEATVQSYIATSSVIALADSSQIGEIRTRSDAVTIAENLFNASLELKKVYDKTEKDFFGKVNYDIYRDIQKAISLCQKNIIQQSLNLPTERMEILQSEISPIKFCFDRLGDINRVDEFIEYNNLQGNEILLMPIGKSVRWIP